MDLMQTARNSALRIKLSPCIPRGDVLAVDYRRNTDPPPTIGGLGFPCSCFPCHSAVATSLESIAYCTYWSPLLGLRLRTPSASSCLATAMIVCCAS